MAATGRHGSRRLLTQALYQHQLAGHDFAELRNQFSGQEQFAKVDGEYFATVLGEILANTASLDALIATQADRPLAQLDPVERGILWLGVTELRDHVDVPVKVVISEAVQMAKEFGAQDSYRYVNALLDSLVVALRPNQ